VQRVTRVSVRVDGATIAEFVAALAASGMPVCEGRFGAHMAVELLNDGPVTFVM